MKCVWVKKITAILLTAAGLMLCCGEAMADDRTLVTDVAAEVDLGTIQANGEVAGGYYLMELDEDWLEYEPKYHRDPYTFSCNDTRVTIDKMSGYWDRRNASNPDATYWGEPNAGVDIFEEGYYYRYRVRVDVADKNAYMVDANTRVKVNGLLWNVYSVASDKSSIVVESPEYGISSRHWNVWVGNVMADGLNKDAIPGVTGGTASYDPDTKTLTLSGVTGVCGLRDGAQITAFGNLNLKGNATLISNTAKYGIKCGASSSVGDLNIDGDFNIGATEYGLYGTNSAGIKLSGGKCEFSGGTCAIYGPSLTKESHISIINPEEGSIANYNSGKTVNDKDGNAAKVVETEAGNSSIDYYDVWVGGIRITSENKDDIPTVEGGTAKYDSDHNELIFDGVSGISGSYKDCMIYANDSIYLYGTATLRSSVVDTGICSKNGSVFIRGNIDVEAARCGIKTEKGKVAVSLQSGGGTGVAPESMTDIEIKGGDYGIYAGGQISLAQAYVKCSATGSSGIAAVGKGFLISNDGYFIAESAGEAGLKLGSGDYLYMLAPSVSAFKGSENALDAGAPSGENISSDLRVLIPEGGSINKTASARYIVKSDGTTRAAEAMIGPASGVWTLTFDMNGHGNKTIGQRYVISGRSAVRPADPFSKDGLTFEGWFKDPAGTTAFDFSKGISADTTIYAKWSGTEIVYPGPGGDTSSSSSSSSSSSQGGSDSGTTTSSSTSKGGSDTGSSTSKGGPDTGSSTSKGGSDTGSSTSKGGSDTGSSTSKGGSDTGSSTSKGGSDTGSSTSKGGSGTGSTSSSAGGKSDGSTTDRKSDDTSSSGGEDRGSGSSSSSSKGGSSDSGKGDGGSDSGKDDSGTGKNSESSSSKGSVSGNDAEVVIPADPEKTKTEYKAKDEDKKSADGTVFDVEVSLENNTYDGTKKKPLITVYDNEGKELKEGADYKVTYKNNKDANTVYDEAAGGFVARSGVKTPTYIVRFKGEYKNSKQIMGTFNINPYPISFALIEPKKDRIVAKEMRSFKFIKKITATLEGKNKKLSLSKDIDPLTMRIRCIDEGENFGREFTMKDNAKAPAGKYMIIVDGKGNYYHSKEDGGFILERSAQ